MLIALLSARWLHERVDALRWAAVVAGFCGVLLMIRPGSQAFHPGTLLCVGNALLHAAFNLRTRRMAATESPLGMQLRQPMAPRWFWCWRWRWRTLMGGLDDLAVTLARRHASASVPGPFLYQQILCMTAWGWRVFNPVPDAVVVGALVVLTSGAVPAVDGVAAGLKAGSSRCHLRHSSRTTARAATRLKSRRTTPENPLSGGTPCAASRTLGELHVQHHCRRRPACWHVRLAGGRLAVAPFSAVELSHRVH